MENDEGEQVSILCYMGLTPSDWRWKQQHRATLRKIFRENKISCDVI